MAAVVMGEIAGRGGAADVPAAVLLQVGAAGPECVEDGDRRRQPVHLRDALDQRLELHVYHRLQHPVGVLQVEGRWHHDKHQRPGSQVLVCPDEVAVDLHKVTLEPWPDDAGCVVRAYHDDDDVRLGLQGGLVLSCRRVGHLVRVVRLLPCQGGAGVAVVLDQVARPQEALQNGRVALTGVAGVVALRQAVAHARDADHLLW
mmetsp:Transcript_79650/g.258017  ORF Transcript_79650/g.258017 Transcript_79650/m.258017 type:complete len:202 (-) Transcript_79650:203-808(-)